MSIFQCTGCGCAENTALTGGFHGPRFESAKVAKEGLNHNGRYCSACWDGEWHGKFERKFYPVGTMETDHEGNLRKKAPAHNQEGT